MNTKKKNVMLMFLIYNSNLKNTVNIMQKEY